MNYEDSARVAGKACSFAAVFATPEATRRADDQTPRCVRQPVLARPPAGDTVAAEGTR